MVPFIFESIGIIAFVPDGGFKPVSKIRQIADLNFYMLGFEHIFFIKPPYKQSQRPAGLVVQRLVGADLIVKPNVFLHAPAEVLFGGVLPAVRFFTLECSKEGFGYSVVQRRTTGREGLLNSTFRQKSCKFFENVLLASVTVKSQAMRVATFLIGCPECSHDQMRAGIAGYSVTDYFTSVHIQNNTEIDPVVLDFELCNIADPYLIGMIC